MYQGAEMNPDDSQYYCCFGKCHALKGAKIIAIIFAVNYLLSAVISLVSLANGYPTNTGISLIGVIVVSCLWFGLSKEREGFLIPFIIYMIIVMIMLGATLVALVVIVPIMFVSFDSVDENELRRHLNKGGPQNPQIDFLLENPSMLPIVLMMMLVIVAVAFSLSIIIFCTVKRAYSYIKQKRWTQMSGAHVFVAIPQMEQGYAPKGDIPPPDYEGPYMKN